MLKSIEFDLGKGVKLEMVLIPAGSFTMGDDNGGSDEKPAHKVRITKAFYLGKYEVTQEQWQALMGNNPSSFKGDKNPVETVSWDDCQEFFKKLNAQFAARAGTFRLPTEAEWEYACRAESTGKYCFGDDEASLSEYAWYSQNSGSKTHPAGEKKANAWGLYDMHGNVWEWCADWYDSNYYKASPSEDPTGPSSKTYRVLRGGSWDCGPDLCRSADRGWLGPGYRSNSLAFRAARTTY